MWLSSPSGGLRLTGYLAVITDPTHNLQQVETALGMPLSILLPDRKVIYQSKKWPDRQGMANSIVGNCNAIRRWRPALILAVADDVRPLNKHLPQARLVVMAGALFITLMSMVLVMWVW